MAKHACAGKQPVTERKRFVLLFKFYPLYFKNALPKKTKTHHSLNYFKNTKFFKYLLHRNLFFNQRPYFAQNIW